MTDTWDSFFVAQVGATAALTGLVFVALSINLSRIIDNGLLVGRAFEALVVLVEPVLLGLVVLSSGHTPRTIGLSTAIVAVGAWLIVARLLWRASRQTDRPPSELRLRAGLAQVAMLPPIIGSIVLISGSTGGIDWIAFGAIAAICVGIGDAWVLLVEILR